MEFDIELVFRFLLAAIWGSIVGAEREYRGKAAGFRTTIMISMGACLFTLISIRLGGPGNADRIASNIVTGIGFLGAGVIFRGDQRVNGITTAATIWAVAAVGMGIGGGYYFAASCGGVLIIIVLSVLPRIERFIDKLHQSREYKVKCSYSNDARENFEQIFRQHKMKYKLIKQIAEGGQLIMIWKLEGSQAQHRALTDNILRDTQFFYFEN